jgi:hypothetical protein
MKTNRILAVLLALPLVAFDCGGEEAQGWGGGGDPFGLGCRLHVAGAGVDEDLWCIMSAYDYATFPEPELASTTWVFELVAYRGLTEVGAGAGFFLDGRPALHTAYGWNGDTASAALISGGAERYGGSLSAGTYVQTHGASSLGAGALPGSGIGALSATFTQIPPPDATEQQVIQVHGSLTATLPSELGGAPVTFTASF